MAARKLYTLNSRYSAEDHQHCRVYTFVNETGGLREPYVQLRVENIRTKANPATYTTWATGSSSTGPGRKHNFKYPTYGKR